MVGCGFFNIDELIFKATFKIGTFYGRFKLELTFDSNPHGIFKPTRILRNPDFSNLDLKNTNWELG